MPILRILAGAAILILGKELFWLFVGGMGFIVGAQIAEQLFPAQSEVLVLVVAIGAGILGALLAVAAQQIAVALAGFFAGGFIGVNLLELVGFDAPRLFWIVFVIAGIIGAVLVIALFDWALIALSSIAGAAIIAREVTLPAPWTPVLFIVLLIAGIAIQAGLLARRRTR